MPTTITDVGAIPCEIVGMLATYGLGSGASYSRSNAYTTASGRNSSRVGQRRKNSRRQADSPLVDALNRMMSSVRNHSNAVGNRMCLNRAESSIRSAPAHR
jgi:hypothetical protein